MLILGIESSCDETAAAVVRDGREVLSNTVSTQIDVHQKYGGVVPEIASRLHSEVISDVVKKAVADSGVGLDGIDGIAVTYAPGLVGSLLVGVNFAKGLAFYTKKPLIPVHHLRGHIASAYLSNKDLEPPFIALVASGGHSHIVAVEDYTRFRVLGRTRDDAAGEVFDKVARRLGLPYPGGAHIEKLALKGNKNSFTLPTPRLDTPFDFSFSGLKTAVINIIHNAEQKNETLNIYDLSAAFTHRVTDILTEKALKAAGEYSCKKLAVTGGVVANGILRQKLADSASENGLKLYLPELKYCGDNAAMIASQGFYEYNSGNTAGYDLNAVPSADIDETV